MILFVWELFEFCEVVCWVFIVEYFVFYVLCLVWGMCFVNENLLVFVKEYVFWGVGFWVS